MATQIASLYADIGAKTQGFEKGAASVKSGLLDIAAKAVVSAGVLTAFGNAIQYSVKEAAAAERVDAQLAAVIESTGGAAGYSASEIQKMASALQSQTTYGDEAIKSSAALLMTFTKIGQEVFPEAQKAVLDMSTALGQDLKSSSIQLGKALNDPVKGITALSRVGVSFTEQQRDLIKSFVEVGDVASAQRVILEELSREFGGSAAAAADTYDGKLQQLKNSVSDLAELYGADLIVELKDFIDVTKSAVEWTIENYEAMKEFGNTVQWVVTPVRMLAKLAGENLKDGFSDAENEADKFAGKLQDDVYTSISNLTDGMLDYEEVLKSITEENKTFLSVLGSIQGAEESYAGTVERLTEQRMELESEKQKLLAQGWWEESEKIQDINAKLEENGQKAQEAADEHELANRRIILGLLERKLMQDGILTDDELNWLLEKGQAWGIYSDTVIAETRAAMNEVNTLAAQINMLPTQKEISIRISTYGNLGAVGDLIPAGARHGGGDVQGGKPYLVGERGAELFMPGQDGKIVPNQNLGGGSNITVNVMLSNITPDPEKVAYELAPAIKRVLRQMQ